MKTTYISLSKGVYGLLKEHLKTNRRLSPYTRSKLENKLKQAAILPLKNLPNNTVGINTCLEVRDIETSEVLPFSLVAPNEAKIKNNKVSILSAIGLALIGYKQGDEVNWEMPEGMKTYKIEAVANLE